MSLKESPIHRMATTNKPHISNPRIKQLLSQINEFFDIDIDEVAINSIYAIKKPLSTMC